MNSHLTTFQKRPISPSCLTSWHDYRDKNHEKWARHYLLDLPDENDPLSQARMDYGTSIHERLATDPKFLPTVPRYDSFEDEIFVDLEWDELVCKKEEHKHNVKCFISHVIPLTGKLDTLSVDLHEFADYKTTQSKTYWTQKVCDDNIQFLDYFALLYLKYDIQPSEVECKIAVIYIDEQESGNFNVTRKLSKDKPKIFTVKHSKMEVLDFLIELKDTYKEMEKFALQFNK